MLSPEGNHYNGFFVNAIDDTPDVDFTVRLATPTRQGLLQVPTQTWKSQEDLTESKSNKDSAKSSTATSPTADKTSAPEFPVRRSSAEIIKAIESANGNMGLFYRRSSAPLRIGGGKVNSIREQFEKKEREKIEKDLLKEAASRGDSERVPIYV